MQRRLLLKVLLLRPLFFGPMASRFRRFGESSRFLTRTLSGNGYEKFRPEIESSTSSRVTRSNQWSRTNTRISAREFQFHRFSSSSKLRKKSTPNSDVLSFIKSTLDKREGPNHCWLNNFEGTNLFEPSGIFLVLSGQFLESSSTNGCQNTMLFEKVKLLKQRYPYINIIVLQSDGFTVAAAARSSLIQLIIKENITFPILLSNKNFDEISDGACYILFKDFKNLVFYHEKDLDFEALNKAVEELHVEHQRNLRSTKKLFKAYLKQDEVINEPDLCYLRNFLLYFPGCISADRGGDRLFISDSNHHRIIVSNENGKILDCIGSSPGFEDGEFESSKLMRPAASYYDAFSDCLYLVDSENHAIRRADMERRVVETLTPPCNTDKKGLWGWFMDKMGWESTDIAETEESEEQTLMFPWHLMKSDDNLLVIDQSFESLWRINLDSGEIVEVVKGFSNILEICGEQIMEKVSILKQIPRDWLQQQADNANSPEELPYGGLISSFTTLQDQLILCDRVGQRILKLSEEHQVISDFRFSNFGVLGLPYWFQPRLERAYKDAGLQGMRIDHVQSFSLLPGRVEIKVNVNVPADTELVEELQEGCIWRQARGVATLASEVEEIMGPAEKVGSAQKWYDELDTLAFSVPETETANEDDDTTSDIKFQDDKVQISSVVNTSPGTSEVIINAVLYLKLRREQNQSENNQEKYASRLMELMSSETNGKFERDSCIDFLLKSNRDLRDLIFARPLHVRVKLKSFDHPKDADNTREIVLTESSIEVNVTL